MATSLAPPRTTLHGAGSPAALATAAQTITYRKPGTQPPVFLAGSFTDPQWVPREMEYTQDEDGEYKYTSQIRAVPGHEYQFKFRVGEGDSWVLDENSPVETDSMGNKNNLLSVPREGPPKATHSVPGKVLSEMGLVGMDSRTSTPVDQVADTAAEVADTAQDIEEDKSESSEGTEFSWRSGDMVGTPLFAHESFGEYNVVADALHPHEGLGMSGVGSQPRSSVSGEYPLDDVDVDVDINDPTIEKFPSDRHSVIDQLRKIQSSLSEDKVQVDNAPPSPRNIGVGIGTGTTAIDFADEGHLSAGSLSPKSSPLSVRAKNENRSRSSFAQPRSAVSLDAIAEEQTKAKPKAKEGTGLLSRRRWKKTRGAVFENPESSASDTENTSARADLGDKKVVIPG